MDLRVEEGEHCESIEVNESDDGSTKVEIYNVNIAEFIDQIMDEDVIKEFFEDIDARAKIVHIIGVDAVLKAFDRDELLTNCTWEYVKEFFLDNIDVDSILNHIGFEKVKEHFSDQIEVADESPNDINIGNEPSMLEALNADGKETP
jgi:hypothetical protein